jgi:hypothetical protein
MLRSANPGPGGNVQAEGRALGCSTGTECGVHTHMWNRVDLATSALGNPSLWSRASMERRGRLTHAPSTDLAFVDTQGKATVWIMTHPDFELDVTSLRSIIREWQ